jgi:hypothetical protein
MRLCEKCIKEVEYNGWTNYETWSIALFIDNEQEWYDCVKEIMKQPDQYDRMTDIKDFIEENIVTGNLTAYQSQLLNASLSEVDWYEVEKHYREE